MSRRGREPWSNRLLVENCLAFDVATLVRAGVFREKAGTLCSTAWKSPSDQEILGAYFYVELTANGKTLLHISYGVPSGRPLVQYGQSESIEIVQTKLTLVRGPGLSALELTIMLPAAGEFESSTSCRTRTGWVAESATT
jgi:hypothetical protein